MKTLIQTLTLSAILVSLAGVSHAQDVNQTLPSKKQTVMKHNHHHSKKKSVNAGVKTDQQKVQDEKKN